MSRRFRKAVERFLIRNLKDYFGGPLHRLEEAAAKKTREELRFASAAERGRLDDGRQPPTTIVPPQPRRTAAEERRRIDDMPVP